MANKKCRLERELRRTQIRRESRIEYMKHMRAVYGGYTPKQPSRHRLRVHEVLDSWLYSEPIKEND